MQKCSQRSTRIATLIVLVSFAVSCRGWKTSVKAMMHRLSAINAHYMDPESHAATSSRGMCTGFTQVETLKGVWVSTFSSAKYHAPCSGHIDPFQAALCTDCVSFGAIVQIS